MIRLFNPAYRCLVIIYCCAATRLLIGMELEHIPFADPSTIPNAVIPPSLLSQDQAHQGISYEALESSSQAVANRDSQSSNSSSNLRGNSYEYPIIRSWFIFRSELERAYADIVKILRETSVATLVSHRECILKHLNAFYAAVNALSWAQLSEEQQAAAWERLHNCFAEFLENVKTITARTNQGSDQRVVDDAILAKIVRMNFAFQGMAKLMYQNSLDKQHQAEALYDGLCIKILS